MSPCCSSEGCVISGSRQRVATGGGDGENVASRRNLASARKKKVVVVLCCCFFFLEGMGDPQNLKVIPNSWFGQQAQNINGSHYVLHREAALGSLLKSAEYALRTV